MALLAIPQSGCNLPGLRYTMRSRYEFGYTYGHSNY